MHFDEILKKYVGEFGLYQIFLLIFCTSVSLFGGINNVDFLFFGAIPDMRCDVSGLQHLEGNLTRDQLLRLTSPKLENGKKPYDSCYKYDRNYSELTVSDVKDILLQNNTQDAVVPCDKWIYSQDQYISTLTTEWNLVCDRYWLVSTSQSVFMAGKFCVFFGGWLSDRFGRRVIALISLSVTIFARILVSWSPHFIVFIIGRFLLSSSAKILYAAVYILGIEMVGPRYRALAGQAPAVYWSLGYAIVAGMAYLLRDWRTLSWAITALYIPFLFLFCFMPESVRWLQSKGRTKAAMKQIHIMSRVNRRKLGTDQIILSENITDDKKEIEKKKSVMEVVKESTGLIKATAILMFLWFSVNFSYYGIIFYLPELGGNIYLSTFISGIMELPALVAVKFTFDTKLGRRFCTSIGFFLCGFAVLTIIVIPKDITWLVLTLAMAGRLFSSYVYSALYVYTTELYPTSIRGSCHSLCSTVSRFGGVIAPYMILLSRVYIHLPELLFGLFTCIGGILTLCLNETAGVLLHDTVEQVQSTYKHSQTEVEGDKDNTGDKLLNNLSDENNPATNGNV